MQQMCAVEFSPIHKFAPPKNERKLSSKIKEFNATWPQSFPHEEKKTKKKEGKRKTFYCVWIFFSSEQLHETKSNEKIEKFRFLISLIVKRDWEMNFSSSSSFVFMLRQKFNDLRFSRYNFPHISSLKWIEVSWILILIVGQKIS